MDKEKELEKGHEKSEEKGHETIKDDFEKNSEDKSFEDEKKAYLDEKMEFEAARTLADEGMPTSFAKILAGNDLEQTQENVAVFKKEFMNALEDALSKRLKGNAPRTGNANIHETDPFLMGFGM